MRATNADDSRCSLTYCVYLCGPQLVCGGFKCGRTGADRASSKAGSHGAAVVWYQLGYAEKCW